MTARTKSDVGYPVIQMSGPDTDRNLQIYPDSVKTESTVALTVTNSSDYKQGINYQWQKLVNGVWTDLGGKESNEITFVSAGQADQGEYRCRLNVINYNSYYISAYSEPFNAVYSKRTAEKASFTATANAATKIPSVSITLQPVDPAEKAAPTGNVTFTIKGTDYEKAYTSALVISKVDGRQSTAVIDPSLATALPDGVYEISASYSGSRVFKSLSEDPITLLVGSDGYQLVLKDEKDKAATSFIYGGTTTPSLTLLSKDKDGNTVNTVITTEAAYSVYHGSTVKGHDLSDTELAALLKTLPVGDYRATAKYDGGSGAVDVAYRYFTIAPRAITVSVAAPFSAAKGQVESNMPTLAVTYGTLVNSETLTGTLGLYVKAINTAYVEVPLNNSTLPANYSIVGALYKPETLPTDTPDQVALKKLNYMTHLAAYQNYTITFISGTYTVTSAQYSVTAECGLVNGNVAGTVAITQPEGHDDVNWTTTYSGGTALYFRAYPKAGYEVKSWTITEGSNPPTVYNQKVNYYAYIMQDQPVQFKVDFKPVDTTLTTRVTPAGGGSISCSDAYFTSGRHRFLPARI